MSTIRKRQNATSVPGPGAAAQNRQTVLNPPKHVTPSDDGDSSGTSDPSDNEDSRLSSRVQDRRRNHAQNSKIARLWLRTRLLNPPVDEHDLSLASLSTMHQLRDKGYNRPLTLRNIRLALRLLILLRHDVLTIFWTDNRTVITKWLIGCMVRSFLPACRLWAQSRMLDLVQAALTTGVVHRPEVMMTAIMMIALQSSDDIYRFLSSRNERIVTTLIDLRLRKLYLSANLALSIPSLSDPYLSALVHEAGVFAGFQSRRTKTGSTRADPFDNVNNAITVLGNLAGIATEVALLVRTITSAGDSIFSMSTLLLMGLALAPSVLRLISKWTTERHYAANPEWKWTRHYDRLESFRRMVKARARHEVILFGLKNWVLDGWEAATKAIAHEEAVTDDFREAWRALTDVMQRTVGELFHVLLALQMLSTKLSLGSIRLYQTSASSIFSLVESTIGSLEEVLQSIFVFAAFCEATRDPEELERQLRRCHQSGAKELLDYDAHRREGGMKLEVHNLSFTYPGTTKKALRGINLVIEPGEQLAIVGLNGGGKTTLVKVLMGLYDAKGSLSVNDLPIESYDPVSIHKRTSCLFQDFGQYELTLRENVGIGDLRYLEEDAKLELALERGGASEVVTKTGLDGPLDPWYAPDVGDKMADHDPESDDDEELGPESYSGSDLDTEDDTISYCSDLHESQPTDTHVGIIRNWFASSWLASLYSTPKVHSPERKQKAQALSGGQWQRVALARAFLKSDDADLVVFDEPSSSLDPKAEAELFQKIHSLSMRGGRKITTIYISHRFSTVRRADKIAVVENGTIIELGTHDELMRLGGRYQELFKLSKDGFEDSYPGRNNQEAPFTSSESP